MAWEYLDTEAFDIRFMVVAGYLRDKIKGKTILDLNCGSARFRKYIPDTYRKYHMNDVRDISFDMNLKQVYYWRSDEEMVDLMKNKKIDILLYFGHGYGERTGEKLESGTVLNSIRTLVFTHKPEYLVFEGNASYEDEYHSLFGLQLLLNKYKLLHRIEINNLLIKSRWSRRYVWILKRQK